MADNEEDSEKQRVLLTIGPDTVEWLEHQYPDADSTPEAVRNAIGDARKFWKMASLNGNHS